MKRKRQKSFIPDANTLSTIMDLRHIAELLEKGERIDILFSYRNTKHDRGLFLGDRASCFYMAVEAFGFLSPHGKRAIFDAARDAGKPEGK